MGTNKEGADWEMVVGNGWQGTGGVGVEISATIETIDSRGWRALAIRKPSNIALFNSFDTEQFIESSCRDY